MTYKAHFVNTGTFKNQFAYSHCVLPISVGQQYHQGEYLEAIISLVNRHFRSCTIIICDVLQRHTLQLLHNELEQIAYNRSLDQGQQWLRENQCYLNQIKHLNGIHHWLDWLSTEQFVKQLAVTEELYQSNASIKSTFDESVNLIVKRLTPRLKHNYTLETVKLACLTYIKEECSIMPLWVTENFHFEVYPSQRVPAMAAIYDHLVKPNYPNCLRWVRLNLRSIPNKLNQQTNADLQPAFAQRNDETNDDKCHELKASEIRR